MEVKRLEPLFLQPVFKERLWGGTALRDRYGYEIPSELTGECWAVSAHPQGLSIILNGSFAGKSLKELWEEHPGLFGHPKEKMFPLLTKILDANMDLSVQVHPDDAYAKAHENGELGKTECWYVIDCKEDAELILGHTARTREEWKRQMSEGNWNELLQRIKIKPGDFFYVPSGTVHALCEGTFILETQQSSDTTYRIFDYHRKDEEGNIRELHLDKALDVIKIPQSIVGIDPVEEKREHAVITTFIESDFFSVYKWEMTGCASFEKLGTYTLCSVIKGEGTLKHGFKEYSLKKGDHFILPANFGNFMVEGLLELIVSNM
ncbi:mannose-6-phosphate isomerase, class I [Bacillus sp. 1P06AnD]|uniref:mannose-6-phosphate isomerase, class I n=1 Tax=Bacillus sp. 1P06AnD TaxID=3132208 RepID=UPI0039A0D0AB